METSTVAVIAAAVGSGITGLFGFVALLLQRRAEERRQIRELAVQVALENWKTRKEAIEKHGGGFLSPVDVYLIHAIFLVSALDGSLKTDEQIREYIRRGFDASKVADEEVSDYNKKI